jgi:hypothetical protein
MLQPAAQRVYLVSALLNLALLATVIAVAMAMGVGRVFALPPLSALLVKILFLPEAIGTGILMVGMSYFWLGFDSSSYTKRCVWLLLVCFGGLLTLPLYYFFVYRRLVSSNASRSPVTVAATPAV